MPEMLKRVGTLFKMVLLLFILFARESNAGNLVRVQNLQPTGAMYQYGANLAEDRANAAVAPITPDSDSDSTSLRSKPKIHPVSVPESRAVNVLHSALEWEHKHEAQVSQHQLKVKGHDPAKVRVSAHMCGVLAGDLKANGCSLVTYLSGAPEGCECTVPGASCPGPPSGFTGVTPSTPFTVGSATVILCMYWQWSDNTGAGKAADAAALHAQSVKNVQNYVNAAWTYSKGNAKALADTLWALTPTPFPRTPPPGGCGGGQIVAHPQTVMKVSYPAMKHGERQRVTCPDGFSGGYDVQCWAGATTYQCPGQANLGLGLVQCCHPGCPEYKKVIVPQENSGTGWAYLYSLSATVDVPKLSSGGSVTLKCPKGWEGSLTYKCLEGNSGVEGRCGTITPNWAAWHSFPGFYKDSPFTPVPTTTTLEPTTTTTPAPTTTTTPEPTTTPPTPGPTTSTTPEPTTSTPWYENPLFTTSTTAEPAPTEDPMKLIYEANLAKKNAKKEKFAKFVESQKKLLNDELMRRAQRKADNKAKFAAALKAEEKAIADAVMAKLMAGTTTTMEPTTTTMATTTTTPAPTTTAGATTAAATTVAATTAAATTAAATTAAPTTAAATTAAATTAAATTAAATTAAATTAAATTAAATTAAATTAAATTAAPTTAAATTAGTTTGGTTTGGTTTAAVFIQQEKKQQARPGVPGRFLRILGMR